MIRIILGLFIFLLIIALTIKVGTIPPMHDSKYNVGDEICYLQNNCKFFNKPRKCVVTRVMFKGLLFKTYVYHIKPELNTIWVVDEEDIEDAWKDVYKKVGMKNENRLYSNKSL